MRSGSSPSADGGQFIAELSRERHLDRSRREQPVLTVDDLYLVLQFSWTLDTAAFSDERQRLQFITTLLISAYTGARPCHLLDTRSTSQIERESDCDISKVRTILYRDIRLMIVRNADGKGNDLLMMQIVFRHGKGEEHMPKQ